MIASRPALAALLALTASAFAAPPSKEHVEFFEKNVRPILAENCYKCHSLEKGKAKGGLTLDTRAGWEKGGENGKPIVPGSPEKSPLIAAIGYLDADLQMPPKGEKLTAAQIATLTEWVKMGAPDPREAAAGGTKLTGLTDQARHHWAYLPVKKPQVPANKNQQWCKTPVDAFILQKLEAKQMLPSPDAGKETLLRRATYDLVGLPPTPLEISAFLADTSASAFEKVVDRLLASPHYGERWGRHWLDTARYSDTIGGDRNNRVTEYRYEDAWTYRDYVVRAFNDDKPYDQFVMEQLAADKLPGAKADDPRLAALGFLTVGERFRNVNDIINDRIDVVSKGFLGLTVSCARCHDHMFDPIPTKDYYALHGVFASIYEPDEGPTIADKATPEQRADFQRKVEGMTKELRDSYYDVAGFYLGELRRAPAAYLQAALAAGRGPGKGGPSAEALQARNDLIKKNNLDEQYVQFLGRALITNPAVFRPIQQIRMTGSYIPAASASPEMAERMAGRMEEQMAKNLGEKAGKLAGRMKSRMQAPTNRIVAEAFTATPARTVDEAIAIYAQLIATHADKAKALIPAMKAATSASVPGFEDDALVEFLRGPFELVPAPLMTKAWIEDSQAGFQNKMSARARFNFGGINSLETSHPGAPAQAMIVADKPRPVNSPVFIRGQAEARGEIVPRHFLDVLSPGGKAVPFTEGSGRLDLARAIVSRDNPLTARVLVNRVWMHHFGEGIVRTPDDLGVQSEPPTHPELLDYLSAYLMDQGWSQKKLHKLIMLSRVYAESSHTRPEYETLDPENRLLWRAHIRRLDFEATRDSLLVFSGQIDRTVGGKPVNLTDEPYSNRRSVYGYIDRGNLPELMLQFDFSDPDMPNSRRTTTVVPQQALFLMNSPMAVDIARKIVARPEVAAAAADYQRIAAIYRVIFQRSPSPQETQLGIQFLSGEGHAPAAPTPPAISERDARRDKRDDLRKGYGASKFGAIQNEGTKVERRPLTAWETYAQALLFSNEAAYLN